MKKLLIFSSSMEIPKLIKAITSFITLKAFSLDKKCMVIATVMHAIKKISNPPIIVLIVDFLLASKRGMF